MNNVFIIKDIETGLFWNKSGYAHWAKHPNFYSSKSKAGQAIKYHGITMEDASILEFSLTEVTTDDSEH